LDLTPDAVEAAFFPAGELNLPALQAQARRLAEARAADLFSEAQLAHAERLAAEREKMEALLLPAEGGRWPRLPSKTSVWPSSGSF
jgi:hypothetical protein